MTGRTTDVSHGTVPPLRFQVNKRVAAAIKRGHPWIYRRQCSSALVALPIGTILRLVGTQNEFLGMGIYQPLSAVAIRVFSQRDVVPNTDFFTAVLLKAHRKREVAVSGKHLSGYRWVHGEADHLPGVSIDVYGDTAVAVFHLESWKTYLPPALFRAAGFLGIKRVVLRYADKGEAEAVVRIEELLADGALRPIADPNNIEPLVFCESGHKFLAFPATGLKTGFFLDLREVRALLPDLVKKDAHVLNLFANDGALSALALASGAARVLSVDRHAAGLAHAKALYKQWGLSFRPRDWVIADAWDFLKSVDAGKLPFDLAIVDPPVLATSREQVAAAEKAWLKLHVGVCRWLAPGAILISVSCTERIARARQLAWTRNAARQAGCVLHLIAEPKTTFDHPETHEVPERNYLRALVWRVD